MSAINNQFVSQCKSGKIESIKKYLTKKGLDPAYNESESLSTCVFNGRYDVLQVLLEDGRANPADYWCHPIRQAFCSYLANQDNDEAYYHTDIQTIKKCLDLMLADDRVTPYLVCHAIEYMTMNSYIDKDGNKERVYKYLRHWNGKGVGPKYRKFINVQLKMQFV